MPVDVRKREAIAAVVTAICFSTISLTAYSAASTRVRQIAVMRALGASRSFVARVVLGELATLILLGVARGLLASTVALDFLSRMYLNAAIPYSGMLTITIVAGLVGLGGALYRTLQILTRFSTFLK